MSDTSLSERSRAGAVIAGIAGAGLLAAKAARAQSAGQHVTLYFDVDPTTDHSGIQIPSTSTQAGSGTAVKVVNFALAVETLEAELYRQSLARLTTGGTTDGLGNTISGLNLSASDLDVQFVSEFLQVESQQRDFLATTLYGSASANPFLPGKQMVYAYNVNGKQGVGTFTRTDVLEALHTAELRGIAAYLGGSKLLPPGSQFLKIAAAALGIEARHSSALAIALNTRGVSPSVETAPLPDENQGRHAPLTADQLLNTGGTIPFPRGTTPRGGLLTPVSGPNGYVYTLPSL